MCVFLFCCPNVHYNKKKVMSQVKHVFGISMQKGEFFEMLVIFFENVSDTHWQSVVLSIICMVILFGLKTWKKHPNWKYSQQSKFIPGALITVIFATIYTWTTDNTDKFKVFLVCLFLYFFFANHPNKHNYT